MGQILVEIQGDTAQLPDNNDDKDGGGHELATFAKALDELDVLHSFSHAKDNTNAEREVQDVKKENPLFKRSDTA